eukprot:gene7667-10431_t
MTDKLNQLNQSNLAEESDDLHDNNYDAAAVADLLTNMENNQYSEYIFREVEFEDDSFHAATFVTKYRKVSSLESMKEQLVSYSNNLKQQLYAIINRDYKDFITIATKLDGVDTRIELLRKPLLDLRLDLSSLHDGMVSSMQALEDKMSNSSEVTHRKSLLETILNCIDKIENAQQLLQPSKLLNDDSNNHIGSTHKVSKREMLLRSVKKYKSFLQSEELNDTNNNQPNKINGSSNNRDSLSSNFDPEISFISSEIERVAYSLSSIQQYLTSLSHSLSTLQSQQQKLNSQSFLSYTSIFSLHKSLELQNKELLDNFIKKVKSRLEKIFSQASAEINNNNINSSVITNEHELIEPNSSLIPDVSVMSCSYCIRALMKVHRGEIAEETFSHLIVEPLIKNNLIPGKVDGKGGRGSYSGLAESLGLILTHLKSFYDKYFDAGESVLDYATVANYSDKNKLANNNTSNDNANNNSNSGKNENGNNNRKGVSLVTQVNKVDFIVNSIWHPISGILSEQYPGMFSVGIPNIMSVCYRAVDDFHLSLTNLAGNRWQNNISNRLKSDNRFINFQKKWKIDTLYFRLRCNEIFNRIDRVCEITVQSGLTAPITSFDEIYKPTKSSTTVIATTSHGVNNSKPATTVTATPSSDVKDNTNSSNSNVTVISLTPNDYEQVIETISAELSHDSMALKQPYNLPMMTVFTCELMTCIHATVVLKPILSKQLLILSKILLRFEAHIILLCNINSISFTKSNIDNIIKIHNTSNPNNSESNIQNNNKDFINTPLKKSLGTTTANISSPSLTNLTNTGMTANAAAVTIEEYILLIHDVFKFQGWVKKYLFKHIIQVSISSDNANERNVANNGIDSSNNIIVFVDKLCGTLFATRLSLWSKVLQLLAFDCKKSLTAVKAIAGKYRMTNKPPPDSASQYVESILSPLRSFKEYHDSTLSEFLGDMDSLWEVELINEVTLSFYDQVKQLMETVKQMDSALQRRSKHRTATQATGSGASVAMSDSEKISLQLVLDIEAFGKEIIKFGIENPSVTIQSYSILLAEVMEKKE